MNEPRKMLAARVPLSIIERIRLESELSGRRIEHIVTQALDAGVPRHDAAAAEPSPMSRRTKRSV